MHSSITENGDALTGITEAMQQVRDQSPLSENDANLPALASRAQQMSTPAQPVEGDIIDVDYVEASKSDGDEQQKMEEQKFKKLFFTNGNLSQVMREFMVDVYKDIIGVQDVPDHHQKLFGVESEGPVVRYYPKDDNDQRVPFPYRGGKIWGHRDILRLIFGKLQYAIDQVNNQNMGFKIYMVPGRSKFDPANPQSKFDHAPQSKVSQACGAMVHGLNSFLHLGHSKGKLFNFIKRVIPCDYLRNSIPHRIYMVETNMTGSGRPRSRYVGVLQVKNVPNYKEYEKRRKEDEKKNGLDSIDVNQQAGNFLQVSGNNADGF